jgi:hypothetical protein
MVELLCTGKMRPAKIFQEWGEGEQRRIIERVNSADIL